MDIIRETPWSRIREQDSVCQIFGDCWQWEFNGQCSRGDNCTFRHDISKRGKVTPSNPSPNSFMQQNERKSSRTRSPREEVPVVECIDGLARITSKELATTHSVKNGILQNACSTRRKSGCRFGEKCSYAHRQVDEQPSERSKKNDDQSAVAMLKKNDWHENVRQLVVNYVKGHERSGRLDKKRDTCHEMKRGPTGRRSSNARQLGCVFQDMTPPKSILRKSTDMQKPIQRVKLTKAVARHT